jgi:hypothetical protein
MAITWGDIQNWKHGNLNTAMQDLATLRKGLANGKSAASKAKGQIQSTGAAANGAKTSLGKLVDELGERVDDATELGLATSEAADGVWDVETKVHECTSFVAQYPYLSIDGDGGVHWENVTPTSFIDMPSLDLSQVTNSTSGLEAGINLVDPAGPGFMAGGAAGAIGGSLLGPVGTVVGGVNGAVGGGIASTIGKGLSLSSSGPIGSLAENREREQKAQELKALIDAALKRAGEVDAAYVKRLVGVRDGTYDHSKLKGKGPQIKLPFIGSVTVPDEEGKPWPPQGVDSPTEVSNWWNSLTEEERQEFMRDNPDAIRNLDGMPGSVRDQLNRKALEKELEQAEKDVKNATAGSEEAKAAQRRFDDLKKIQETMGQPDRQLLGLDTSGKGDVRAIVASGDVDKAQNIGTVVPGISTTARDSMDGLMEEANTLRNASGAEHTATVAYLGYDAPPAAEPWKDQNGSLTDIGSTETADKAAPGFNRFNEGLQSWQESQGRDPRIGVFAHSYGSLMAATAMRDAKIGAVDVFEMHGSPGGRADSVHEYNVSDGNVYATVNGGDYVAGVGSDDFGRDPNTLDGIGHLSSNDGGHSDYWKKNEQATEFAEDAAQILNGEDPSVDRPDNRAEAATRGH